MTRHFIANRPPWLGLFYSILGALFGVQSPEVHKKDFTEGKPWVFAIAGIITTIVLIIGLSFAVKLLLTYLGAQI